MESDTNTGEKAEHVSIDWTYVELAASFCFYLF